MRSEDLIKKYISGTLTSDERYELEKIALDDDFLGDAYEGLSGKIDKNPQETLDRLQARIEKKKEAKIIPMFRWQSAFAVAASIALLFTLLFFLITNDPLESSEENIAIVVEQIEDDHSKEYKPSPLNESPSIDEIKSITNIESNEINQNLLPPENVEMTRSSENLKTVPEEPSLAATSPTPLIDEDEKVVLEQSNDEKISFANTDLNNDGKEKIESTREISNDAVITKIVDQQKVVENEVADKQNEHSNTPPVSGSRKKEGADVANFSQPVLRKANQGNRIQALSPEDLVFSEDIAGDCQPVNGFEEFRKSLFQNTSIGREDLFMENIKSDFEAKIRFKVDQEGRPVNIQVTNLNDGPLKKKLISLFESSGQWKECTTEFVFYITTIPTK